MPALYPGWRYEPVYRTRSQAPLRTPRRPRGAQKRLHIARDARAAGQAQQAPHVGTRTSVDAAHPEAPKALRSAQGAPARHYGPPGSSPTSTSTGTKREEPPQLRPARTHSPRSKRPFWTARRAAEQGDGPAGGRFWEHLFWGHVTPATIFRVGYRRQRAHWYRGGYRTKEDSSCPCSSSRTTTSGSCTMRSTPTARAGSRSRNLRT